MPEANDSYEQSGPEVPAYLGTTETARRLRVARRTVLNMIADGRLVPSAKVAGPLGGYLFDAEQIEALAAERTAEALR